MGDLFAWLMSFFVLIILLAILGFQLMCFTDLEFDYINPYDSAYRINNLVLPEFVTQGILCFIHLIAGHWVVFLMSLPYLYYNWRLYMRRQHLVDVTEIYSQLPWEKKQRLYKLCYLIILLTASIFWMVWSIGEEFV